jgi:hypothetical protein
MRAEQKEQAIRFVRNGVWRSVALRRVFGGNQQRPGAITLVVRVTRRCQNPRIHS